MDMSRFLLRMGLLWVAMIAVPLHGDARAKPFRVAPDEAVLQSFDELKAHIDSVPNDVLNKGRRDSLLVKVKAAKAAYRRGQVCTAENVMNAYLHHVQAMRTGLRVAVAETLYAEGRALRDSFFDIFASDPDLPAPRCYDPAARREPEVTIVASDNKRFAARVTFGAARIWTVEAGGETWTELELPALPGQGGVPGLPALPVWRALVAVPTGASAALTTIGRPRIAETFRLNLYPYQSEAADADLPAIDPEFANPPFAKNDELYGTDARHPPDPCSVRPVGQYRDLEIVQVLCAAGQYNPVTDELRLFRSLAFDIAFEDGDDHFVTTQTLSPFEPASSDAIDFVLNKVAVAEFVMDLDISSLVCIGEELLILTHPDFRAAADTLALWKRDKGITTKVIEVGAGTDYETADEIDDLIEHLYDTCQVRPSYVLLLGDSEYVPPARTDYDTTGAYCETCGDDTTGSDWGYAIYPQNRFDAFYFPDFAVGRISVNALSQAQTVVEKIITYEADPPFINMGDGAPFYTTAGLTGQFQCCRMNRDGSPRGGQDGRAQRSFIETLEVVRNTLIAAGKSVQRIYMETVDYGGYCLVNTTPCPADQWQDPYAGDTTPDRYYNGGLLPADLRAGSGFAWNGWTQDIANAFNDGRFLITHRDHGSSSGFAHPDFGTGDLDKLSNDELLPVVFSVNCSSGFFDRETDSGSTTESFMERILFEEDGGMVGGLGDVRNSPTWANSALTRGFFEATWPNLAPGYAGPASKRRLADILNHGKVYLLTQVGVPQTAGSVSLEAVVAENVLWHAYGDPTLEMWTRNPYALILGLDYSLEQYPSFLRVAYTEDGAVITAWQQSADDVIPVGRAPVIDGVAKIHYFHQPDSALPIMLSASRENAVSVLLTNGTPTGAPNLMAHELNLSTSTASCDDDLSTMLGVQAQGQSAKRVSTAGQASAEFRGRTQEIRTDRLCAANRPFSPLLR